MLQTYPSRCIRIKLENPVIEARGRAAAADGVLSDPMSGLMRGAGQNYSSAGVMAAVEHRMPAAIVFA